MDLPSKEKTFTLDYTAESGKEYKGQFTVRCVLNIGQKHGLALEQTRLLGNYPNPTPALAGFAMILGTLRAKIVDAPEWWKQSQGGMTVDDEDALVTLYDKVEEVSLEWKMDLKKKTEAIPEEN